MKRCTACKDEKPEAEFYRNKRMKDGLGANCKACADTRSASSRSKKPILYAESRKQSKRKARDQYMNEKRALGCACCTETEPICLEWHHTHPAEKDIDPNKLRNYSARRREAETDKCILVCSNCHKKIHAKLVTHTKDGLPVFCKLVKVKPLAYTQTMGVALVVNRAGQV